MTKCELEIKRDDIVKQIQEYQEQLRIIDEELVKFEMVEYIDPTQPIQMYQDYKRW